MRASKSLAKKVDLKVRVRAHHHRVVSINSWSNQVGALSSILRSITAKNGDKAVAFYCPGCKEVHAVWIKGPVAWEYNNDPVRPTFKPSYRTYLPATDDMPERTLCHCYITSGLIQYLSDCAHELKSQTVPIPDWPYMNGAYGGVDE